VEVRPADDLVREPWVLAVVPKWRTVDAGGTETGRQRDTDGRGGIPFVLAAEMHVGFCIAADHRHRLRAGRAHVDQLSVERLGDGQGLGRGVRAAHHQTQAARRSLAAHRRRRGGHHHVQRRQRHRSRDRFTVDDQRDVDCPIGPSGLAELSRPVERVHDPDSARAEPFLVVDPFLGEDGVVGTLLGEQSHEQFMCDPIPLVAKALRVPETDLLAQRHQRPSRSHRREAGELVV
jgi:hypothetical protein